MERNEAAACEAAFGADAADSEFNGITFQTVEPFTSLVSVQGYFLISASTTRVEWDADYHFPALMCVGAWHPQGDAHVFAQGFMEKLLSREREGVRFRVAGLGEC